eukprot:9470522-Pyramimonas_sp.AAC.1
MRRRLPERSARGVSISPWRTSGGGGALMNQEQTRAKFGVAWNFRAAPSSVKAPRARRGIRGSMLAPTTR